MGSFFKDLIDGIKSKKLEVLLFLLFVAGSVWLGIKNYREGEMPSLALEELQPETEAAGGAETEQISETVLAVEEGMEVQETESVVLSELEDILAKDAESETGSELQEAGLLQEDPGETENPEETAIQEEAESRDESSDQDETEFPEESENLTEIERKSEIDSTSENAETEWETDSVSSDLQKKEGESAFLSSGLGFWAEAARKALNRNERETETETAFIHPDLPEREEGYSAFAVRRKEALFPALESYIRVPGIEIPKRYLQPEIERNLERILSSKISEYDGTWSIYFHNLKSGKTISLNPQPMKSASVMKLFVMGTVYREISRGRMERTDEISGMLKDMIVFSGNEDSNRLLYLLGGSDYAAGIRKVNEFIRDYGFSDQTIEFNGFNSESVILDREHMNQVTAEDCGKMLEAIYRREWGSRNISEEIETMLLAQDTRDKIPRGLPDNILCGNKTGEMDGTQNDAAIVYAPACDYILVVLSNGWDNKDTAIERIRRVSSTVYAYVNKDPEQIL